MDDNKDFGGGQKYIVAIDTSGSTSNCTDYFRAAIKICEMFDVTEFISWNTSADILKTSRLHKNISCGGTQPQYIVFKLREIYADKLENLKDYGLVILSDGQISTSDINHTKVLLENEPKITFREIKLFYFGNVNHMNTGLNEVFKDIPTEIFINQLDASILNTDIKYTKDDIKNILDKTSNELLSMINYFVVSNDHKHLLEIKKVLQNSFIEEYNLTEFVEKNDIQGCVKFLNDIGQNVTKKVCQNVINLIDKFLVEKRNLSLSRLATFSNIYEKEMTAPVENPNNEEGMQHECEITYTPCNAIGIGVKEIENLCKKYGKVVIVAIENNPFKLLTDDPLMQEIRSVIASAFEYNKISAYITKKLDNYVDPFTRDNLIGWFYFADPNLNDKGHVRSVLNNNMFIVGNIFNGIPKMRGNWHVWHLIVLYILGTEHKKHSQESEIIFEQIRYLSMEYTSYLPLTPFYEPSIKDKLYNCFWYMCNICPEFQFGSSNVLRIYGTGLVQFCKTSFNFDDSQNLMRFEMWKLWENVVRNMKYVDALRMLKSRFQNYLYIDEKCYLLNGKSKDGNSAHINPIIPDNIIHQMILELNKNSSPNVFCGSLFKLPEPFEVAEDVPIYHTHGYTISDVNNIRMCTTTYRPTVLDFETGKPWREIVNPRDCTPDISLFNLYVKFIREYQKHPKNSKEFLKYLFNKYKYKIWPSDICKSAQIVFDYYQPFVKIEIEKLTLFSSPEKRLILESTCLCSAHNRNANHC